MSDTGDASTPSGTGAKAGVYKTCGRCGGTFRAGTHKLGQEECTRWLEIARPGNTSGAKKGKGAGAAGGARGQASPPKQQSTASKLMAIEGWKMDPVAPPQEEGWQASLADSAPRRALSVAGMMMLGEEGGREWQCMFAGTNWNFGSFTTVQSLEELHGWEEELNEPASGDKASGKEAPVSAGREVLWFENAVYTSRKGEKSVMAVVEPQVKGSKMTVPSKAATMTIYEQDGQETEVALIKYGDGPEAATTQRKLYTVAAESVTPIAGIPKKERGGKEPKMRVLARGWVGTERPGAWPARGRATSRAGTLRGSASKVKSTVAKTDREGAEVATDNKRAMAIQDWTSTPLQVKSIEEPLLKVAVRAAAAAMSLPAGSGIPALEATAGRGHRARMYESIGCKPVVAWDGMPQDPRWGVRRVDACSGGPKWAAVGKELGGAALVHVDAPEPALGMIVHKVVTKLDPALLSTFSPMGYTKDNFDWGDKEYCALWTIQLGRTAAATHTGQFTFAPGLKWTVWAPTWLIEGLEDNGGWSEQEAREWAAREGVDITDWAGQEVEWEKPEGEDLLEEEEESGGEGGNDDDEEEGGSEEDDGDKGDDEGDDGDEDTGAGKSRKRGRTEAAALR